MSNIRPWFADEIAQIIKSILFTTLASESEDYKRGFLACAVAICMAVGININDVKKEFSEYYETNKE